MIRGVRPRVYRRVEPLEQSQALTGVGLSTPRDERSYDQRVGVEVRRPRSGTSCILVSFPSFDLLGLTTTVIHIDL